MLLGYMGIEAGVHVTVPNQVLPALFKTLFPSWFAGLPSRQSRSVCWCRRPWVDRRRQPVHAQCVEGLCQPGGDPYRGGAVAKLTSLVVKVGALTTIANVVSPNRRIVGAAVAD